MKSGFNTKIGITALKIISLLPFGVLYLVSDLLYPVIYYWIGYRKKVVFKNLKKSFPDKEINEITGIAKKFYRHFCDLTLETIKMQRMSESDFKKRLTFENFELTHELFEQGKSCVVMAMHYNNWEWGTYLAAFVSHKTLAVYRPLQNPDFGRYMNRIRTRSGIEMIKDDQILRRFLKSKENGEPVMIWLAGDQTPPGFHKGWFRFLNQDALFYPGPAMFSKKYNLPVFFQHTIKNGRGRYIIRFEPLIENPELLTEAEITRIYIAKMEEIIKEKPEFYLWSHRRWKHKRPENIPVQNN